MSKVICINDDNLPTGAEVVKGKEYEVIKHFRNALDQNVYIIKGVNNGGTTKWGLEWEGYRANRFKMADSMMDVIFADQAEIVLN